MQQEIVGTLRFAVGKYWKSLSKELVDTKLGKRVSKEALERLEWHKSLGHRLVLVTATIKPMAEAMSDYLGMDEVYGCGPDEMTGIMSGSEKDGACQEERERFQLSRKMRNIKDTTWDCWGYGNTHADSFFMSITGNPVAVNAEGRLKTIAIEKDWLQFEWRV